MEYVKKIFIRQASFLLYVCKQNFTRFLLTFASLHIVLTIIKSKLGLIRELLCDTRNREFFLRARTLEILGDCERCHATERYKMRRETPFTRHRLHPPRPGVLLVTSRSKTHCQATTLRSENFSCAGGDDEESPRAFSASSYIWLHSPVRSLWIFCTREREKKKERERERERERQRGFWFILNLCVYDGSY